MSDSLLQSIEAVYKSAGSYPELVEKLIKLGVLGYTVDTATSIILYRFGDGKHVIHFDNISPRNVAEKFDQTLVKQAILNNQQKKTDYPAFMNEIANAGVYFYEATLTGPDKRVTYIGCDAFHEEKIPNLQP